MSTRVSPQSLATSALDDMFLPTLNPLPIPAKESGAMPVMKAFRIPFGTSNDFIVDQKDLKTCSHLHPGTESRCHRKSEAIGLCCLRETGQLPRHSSCGRSWRNRISRRRIAQALPFLPQCLFVRRDPVVTKQVSLNVDQ